MLEDRGASPISDDASQSSLQARVLLVEPDPLAATWIADMLRTTWSEGLVVAHADRLADATEELLSHAATCILLDVSRFEDDPLGAVDQLRTAAPNAPIIVLADSDDERRALDAVRAGAQDYLIKSELGPTLLSRAVKYAIERKRSEVKLAYQALHDPLTGLPNRALFHDRLGVALDRARRSGTTIAVLFLDVDNFKQVNDSLGHAAGDRVLVGLADRLRTMLRPMDTVARFGGDEFTFLVEDLASEREVVLVADRINRAANLPIPLQDGRASITVSIGIAVVAGLAVAPETVIREADAAMYRAKRRGRGGYELFDETSRRRALARLNLESALGRALERSELRVHYQPGVSLDGQTGVASLEALLRWRHPERGLLAPSEFLPMAEETGLIIPIGQYVLEHALAQLSIWRGYLPALTVSVNVSARQLEDVSLISMLDRAFRAAAVDPSALCLEIAESAITHDPASALVALRGLKALGVRLAIDDFGAGSSSLASLKALPIHTIKLHVSVVSGLGSDPRETPIVGAVVELGHALGFNVVAKGVETEAQAAELRAIGCDGAQGFLFGRPVPEGDVPRLLIGAGSVQAGSSA